MAEPMSPRRASRTEQHWQVLQKRTFSRYINSKLAGRSLVVGDLYEDLKSGVLLYHFLEVLTGENLKQYGKLNSGKMRIQHVANMNVVFKFFPDADIKLENIGVMDIVDGNPTSVLGLIWSIIAFYLVKQLGDGGDGDNLAGIKQKILRWCKARASPKVPVTNLTDSFADGRAFLAILNKTDNAGSPYVPEADPCANFRTAFADAEAKYGVPQMLTPDDPDLYTDEISMLTYLSEMMAKLPDNVAQPDPFKAIEEYVDDHALDLEDDLAKLCACASTPSDAGGRSKALNIVEGLMQKAGLCASKPAWSDALGAIVARTPEVGGVPTVLFYATTGVEANAPASGFSPVSGGGVLRANAARGDKAGVVAPLMALQAIGSVIDAKDRRCNVVVVVGAAPPSFAAVADAVDAGDVPRADYVVVSAAGASSSVNCGSRGYVDVTVGCSVPPEILCALHVGPLVDPALALAAKIGGLRHGVTAALQTQRAADLPALPLGAIDVVSPGESANAVIKALQAAAGYEAQVAPEFAAAAQAYAKQGAPAACALAFEPALTVQKLWTASPPKLTATRFGGSECLPQAACATLRAMLPPGYTDLEAAAASVLKALRAAEPSFGFEVSRVGEIDGCAGYLSDSRGAFANLLKAEVEPIVAMTHADHSAVASAFDQKFFDAAVFEVGLAGDSDDVVEMADVVRHTKALARLLHAGFEGIPGKAAKLAPYGAISVAEVPRHAAFEKGVILPPPPKAAKYVSLPKAVAAPTAAPAPLSGPAPPAPPLKPAAAPAAVAPPRPPVVAPKLEATPEVAPVPRALAAAKAPAVVLPLTTVEDLVAELNTLRANPRAYVKVLEATLSLYKDDKSFWPSTPADAQPFMTHEGAAAVREAISFMEGHDEKLKPLKLHPSMSLAAKEHAQDLVQSGDRLGHTGSDGSKPAARLARHGRWFERASECLAYRHATAAMLVAQLVVDDGMPSRTQRETILSPDMRAVGAAVVQHPTHGVLAVLTLAGGFGPFPLEASATVEAEGSGAVSAAFTGVLDSIPVLAVHEQVEQALARGDKVELAYEPGSLKMTIWNAAGEGQLFGVDWEK